MIVSQRSVSACLKSVAIWLRARTVGGSLGLILATGAFSTFVLYGCNPSKADDSGRDTRDSTTTKECPVAEGYTSLCYAKASYVGESSSYYLGTEIAGASDINGDGIDDFATSWWVFIVYGPVPAGEHVLSHDRNLVQGIPAGQVASAGDINGDGYSDILAGDESADEVTLLMGSSEGIPRIPAVPANGSGVQVFEGESNSSFGMGISSVGDLDLDGNPDLAIGSNLDSTLSGYAGAVYVFRGPFPGGVRSYGDADAVLYGDIELDEAGWDVAGLGDIDGDGSPEIGVGSYHTAYVIEDTLDSVSGIENAGTTIDGGTVKADSIEGIGDINQDGYGDFAVGSFDYQNTGALFVFFGRSSLPLSMVIEDGDARLVDDDAGWYVGVSAAGVGDVNGDNVPDLLVGSVGVAYLVYGPADGFFSLQDSAAKYVSEPLGYGAGWSVSPAGDADGDGLTDLLVGDPYYCVDDDCQGKWAEYPEGAVYLISGSDLP